MDNHFITRSSLVCSATWALALMLAMGGARADDVVSANDEVSSYLRDYLSDPRRVGSLSGSIMGGALTAHPVGPIIGSLIGFFIGKQSMFNEDKVRAKQQQAMAARRDIVPSDDSDMDVIATAGGQDDVGVSAPVTPLPALTREQVASICAGGVRGADPRLRGLCFYSQSQ